jgi:hypothetical protein
MSRKISNTTGIFLLLLFTALIIGCTFESNIEELRKKLASSSESEVVPGKTLAEQLNWLQINAKSSTTYLLTVSANEDLVPYILSYSGKSNITLHLKGDTVMRTVSLSGNGTLFTVGSGVTLILENNITLRGHSNNNKSLIIINAGGVLEMHERSVVTGNNCATASGGGVRVNGTFVMNGGEISGNTASGSSNGGGVLVDSNGTFTMNGGKISGNTVYNGFGGGVYVFTSGGTVFIKIGGTIYGYTAEDSNSNAVKLGSGAELSGQGHAVYLDDSSNQRRRETTAGPNVNLDSNVPGIEGGWEN